MTRKIFAIVLMLAPMLRYQCAQGQGYSVSVDANGVIRLPANFTGTNNILTNFSPTIAYKVASPASGGIFADGNNNVWLNSATVQHMTNSISFPAGLGGSIIYGATNSVTGDVIACNKTAVKLLFSPTGLQIYAIATTPGANLDSAFTTPTMAIGTNSVVINGSLTAPSIVYNPSVVITNTAGLGGFFDDAHGNVFLDMSQYPNEIDYQNNLWVFGATNNGAHWYAPGGGAVTVVQFSKNGGANGGGSFQVVSTNVGIGALVDYMFGGTAPNFGVGTNFAAFNVPLNAANSLTVTGNQTNTGAAVFGGNVTVLNTAGGRFIGDASGLTNLLAGSDPFAITNFYAVGNVFTNLGTLWQIGGFNAANGSTLAGVTTLLGTFNGSRQTMNTIGAFDALTVAAGSFIFTNQGSPNAAASSSATTGALKLTAGKASVLTPVQGQIEMAPVTGGTTNRLVNDKFGEALSLLDFVPSGQPDGVTDNGPGMTNAILSCYTNHSALFIPPSTNHWVGNFPVLTNGLRIYGVRGSSPQVTTNGAGSYPNMNGTVITPWSPNEPVFQIGSDSGFVVGVKIQDMALTTSNGACGILVAGGALHTRLQDLQISGFTNNIWAEGGTNYPVFETTYENIENNVATNSTAVRGYMLKCPPNGSEYTTAQHVLRGIVNGANVGRAVEINGVQDDDWSGLFIECQSNCGVYLTWSPGTNANSTAQPRAYCNGEVVIETGGTNDVGVVLTNNPSSVPLAYYLSGNVVVNGMVSTIVSGVATNVPFQAFNQQYGPLFNSYVWGQLGFNNSLGHSPYHTPESFIHSDNGNLILGGASNVTAQTLFAPTNGIAAIGSMTVRDYLGNVIMSIPVGGNFALVPSNGTVYVQYQGAAGIAINDTTPITGGSVLLQNSAGGLSVKTSDSNQRFFVSASGNITLIPASGIVQVIGSPPILQLYNAIYGGASFIFTDNSGDLIEAPAAGNIILENAARSAVIAQFNASGGVALGSAAAGTDPGTNNVGFGGNAIFDTTGGGLQFKSGSNARAGLAILVGGTVTIPNTTISSGDYAVPNYVTSATAIGTLTSVLTNSTSLTINSKVVATGLLTTADTNIVSWELHHLN